MHKHVEVLIGRLATDPELRRRFAEAPLVALRELRLELSEIELAALAATDPAALRAFADALDPRLCRASLGVHGRSAGGHPTTSAPRIEKEHLR